MTPIRRISLIAGSAAITAALAGVNPAQAEDTTTMLSVAEPAELGALSSNEAIDVANLELNETEESEFVAVPVEITVPETAAEVHAAPAVATSEALVLDETVATDASTLLATDIDDTLLAQGQEVAQVTRPLYRGAAPFYLGVGGNIGIADSNESATGDFGFALISKISLGPRFSLRPSLVVSEDKVSLPIPLTYNFDPISVGENIALYPFGGVGADVSFDGETGLLLNGGVDIPISRAFTLNAQTNWRVTGDFGLGLILGVGYNFPFFFE